MKIAVTWQQDWNESGVRLTRADDAQAVRLTHADIAALNEYDARLYGLPHSMEAILTVRIEGRIDHPEFSVDCTLESVRSLQIWPVYRREGARMFIGARALRLNRHQLALFVALENMQEAGADIAARLRAWPALDAALNAPSHSRILVQGRVPRILISTPAAMPEQAMVRSHGKLQKAAGFAWGMLPRRRYVLVSE